MASLSTSEGEVWRFRDRTAAESLQSKFLACMRGGVMMKMKIMKVRSCLFLLCVCWGVCTLRIVDVANCVLSGEAIEHLLSALEVNDTLSILVLAHNSMNRRSILKLAEVLKHQHSRIFMSEEKTEEKEEEGKRNEEREDERKDKKDEEGEEKRKISEVDELETREEKKDTATEDKKKEGTGEVSKDEEAGKVEKKEEKEEAKESREKIHTHATLGSSSPDPCHDHNEPSPSSPSSCSPPPPSCSPPPRPLLLFMVGVSAESF